jgi:transcriptional regulator with XRE-family HTH domain
MEMDRSEAAATIKKNVKTRRQELGLTQQQAADLAGITQGYLAQVETGKRLPTTETLIDLASALQTTPAAILSPEIFSGTS